MSRAAWLVALAAAAAQAQPVTIEKATIPWSELERLMRREGAQSPHREQLSAAPRGWSLSTARVEGAVEGAVAHLDVSVELEVLRDEWTVVPLFGAGVALSSAQVSAPERKRGLLVRDPDAVSLVAEGAGRYQLSVRAVAPLEVSARGRHLSWAPPGLSGGTAELDVRGAQRVSGKTRWTVVRAGQSAHLSGPLGAGGLDLVLESGRPEETETDVGAGDRPELEAMTVLSLGGRGVTRAVMLARPDASGHAEVTLPRGARPWKSPPGAEVQPAGGAGPRVRVPLSAPGWVELAYTFEDTPLGIRGRYRVELPRLGHAVRGARWELWLPDGLSYRETQSSLPAAHGCGRLALRSRTPLEALGQCRSFARPVLESGAAAYVEGAYEQPL